MNILIACEESQEVCKAFRAKGHEAFSCDIQSCSGGHPEWHIKADIKIPLSAKKHDGSCYWDMIIAHPPCTYLSRAGIGWFYHDSKSMTVSERFHEMKKAREFFMLILNHPCNKICIENPQPHRFAELPKYSQLIEPWHFGGIDRKKTALWLKGLPMLAHKEGVKCPAPLFTQTNGKNRYFTDMQTGKDKKKLRSKTFPEIAKAMANQWG